MSKRKPSKLTNETAVALWHTQLQTASQTPWLASLMLKRARRLQQRLAYFYQQLTSLPRRWRRRIQRGLATSLVGAALLLALGSAPTVHAATITVTPGAAGINGSDGCSLVEAIINANNDDQSGSAECNAGYLADTIHLSGNTYNYLVGYGTPEYYGNTTALPEITSKITIEGAGSVITRDNATSFPHFRIMDVTVSGDLTLNQVTLSNGRAVIPYAGGGIRNQGTTNILNSSISGNYAGRRGGGAYNEGILTLTNSTVNGNSGYNYGGGLYNKSTGNMTITNSTISNNTSTFTRGGAGLSNDGIATINGSTITGNQALLAAGGGIYQRSGSLTLNHSLVSGNSDSGSGNELHVVGGTVTANNSNLFGHSGETEADAFHGFAPGVNDWQATSNINYYSYAKHIPTALTDILDTSLQDNGGDTLTHDLVNGSPAVDAALSGETTDQRGNARPYGLRYDIGAVESSFSRTAEAEINSSQCLLEDAIVAANTDTATGACAAGNAGADTITLLSSVDLETQNHNINDSERNGLPQVMSEITIEGAGFSITRSSSRRFRILDVTVGGDLTLKQITISNGKVPIGYHGAGVHNLGTTEIRNSTVSNSYAGHNGGGVYNAGTLTVSNSTVNDNSSYLYGSGLFNESGGNMTITNSTISANVHMGSRGGAGLANRGTTILNNSTLTGNYTEAPHGHGGGIFQLAGSLTLNQSLISGNSAALTGDEIRVNGGTVTANNGNLFGHSGKTETDAFHGFAPGASDIQTTSDSSSAATHIPTALANIMDSTLQNNGGNTLTHALMTGSPAIDAASVGQATDQRGELRPAGSNYDIGAFEYIPAGRIVTLNGDGSADISFTPGLELYGSSDPYSGFVQVGDTSGAYNHPGATLNPSYWQLRTSAGSVVDSFGIFPFPIVPGS